MMKRLVWLAAPAVFLFASAAAAAPTKSFTAASANLPGDTQLVGTSSIKTVRSTKVFQSLFPQLLKSERDLNEANDKITKLCGIDAVKAIDDVTIGVGKGDEAGIYVAMNGVSESKLVDCITKLAKDEKEVITSSKSGNITELKSDKSKKSVFFGWLTGDVLVVTSDPNNKALLEKEMGGKGALAKSTVGARLSRLSSDAAISVVFDKELPMDGMKIKSGELTVTVSGGNATLNASFEMGSKKEAEDVAKFLNDLLNQSGMKKPPASVQKVAKTLSAKASNAEVKVTATAAESDIISAFNDLLNGSSGAGAAPAKP
ncbi:MAG: hypothetical protein U0271_15610 [Polyangiaceae bacterium]